MANWVKFKKAVVVKFEVTFTEGTEKGALKGEGVIHGSVPGYDLVWGHRGAYFRFKAPKEAPKVDVTQMTQAEKDALLAKLLAGKA